MEINIGWPGEKLAIKLVDTLKEGIGASFRPWQIKREESARIESRRRERLALEQAERDAAMIRSGEKALDKNWQLISGPNAKVGTDQIRQGNEVLATNSQSTLNQLSFEHKAREVQRGINLRKIAIFAEEESEFLNDADEVSEEPVDPDWFAKWRSFAEDVNREEMQRLWGRILAGEVKAPGKYSIHTIDFLSRMSKSDADLIAKLAKFSLGHVIFKDAKKSMNKSGIEFSDLIFLSDLNFLNGVSGVGGLQWPIHVIEKNHKRFVLIANNNFALILFAQEKNIDKVELPIYSISRFGQELLSLANVQGCTDYLAEIRDYLLKKGFCSPKIGTWNAKELIATDITDFTNLLLNDNFI